MNLDDQIADIVLALEREGVFAERFTGTSSAEEIRFGKHGSLAVIVRGSSRGKWYDHEQQEGGGPWDLIGRNHNDPAAWLRDHGFADGGDRDGQAYDYTDENGTLLFQVVRRPGHKFLQRRPDRSAADGWNWKLGDTRRVLYHLPELIAAKATGNGHPWRVYLCEGEKDADRLRRDWGVVATTNPGGAKSWLADFNKYFAGAEVILLEDNDEAGRERSKRLAPQLVRAGAVVRIVSFPELPEKGDISDWMDDGGTQSVIEDVIDGIDAYHINGHDPDPAPPRLWHAIELSYWAGRQIPAREWIMEDWVPRSQTTGLYGASGVLKTTWLLQLMMAASAGLHFCGLPITQIPVYGLFCEDTTEEIARRAARIAEFYERDLNQFPNFHYASLVGIMGSELITFDQDGFSLAPAYGLLEAELAAVKPGLLVLDTLPDFFGGNEINRRETSNFIRMLDSISMMQHCAILAAAHPSVSGRRSGRFDSGNTGIEGKMRARLSLHDPGDDEGIDEETPEERAHRVALHPTDKRILTRQNSNYAKPGETIELVIRDGAFFPSALDPAAAAQSGPMRTLAIRSKFLECLRAIKKEGRYVHDAPTAPSRYAPAVFKSHPLNYQTRFSRKDFESAMRDLLGGEPQRIALHMVGRTGSKHVEFYEL